MSMCPRDHGVTGYCQVHQKVCKGSKKAHNAYMNSRFPDTGGGCVVQAVFGLVGISALIEVIRVVTGA